VRPRGAQVRRTGGVPRGHMPFTPRGKKVLELSLREAKKLRHHYVGTEHLLLGLLREGRGMAAQVLVGLGADHARVRERVRELLPGGSGEAVETAARARLVRMSVPEDLGELEEQISQVRRQKEAAIDAEDFETAAALRDREQALLVRKESTSRHEQPAWTIRR
jgi:ATP-dependent Clp protease ATP-binding subunit ClpA